jgi:hypothetical protein
MSRLQHWLDRLRAKKQRPDGGTEKPAPQSRNKAKGQFICRGGLHSEVGDMHKPAIGLLCLDGQGNFVCELAKPSIGEHISTFAASPDGRWIAYTCYVPRSEANGLLPEIRAVSFDKQKTCTLTRWDARSQPCYLNPVFSPRGDKLACEFALKHTHNPNLMILELDEISDSLYGGAKIDILNPLQIGNYAPQFLAEGERLVYFGNYDYEDLLEICLYDPGMAETQMWGYIGKRLTENAHGVWRRPKAIAVQPEYEQLFFIRGHTLPNEQICVFSLSDISPGAVIKGYTAIGGEYHRIGSLQVSSDGQWLAFDGNDSIYVIATDGSNLRRLTPDGMSCQCPSFSQDGTRVAFVSQGKIYMVGIQGDQLTQLTGDELIVEEFVLT